MYRCRECDTISKKKNKTKQDQSKKDKYFSNLILNKYVIKDIPVDKFKDITQYYNKHIKKFIVSQFVFIGMLMM